MSILWCGGEDIDFPNGAAPTISTFSGYLRTGYNRCAVGSSGAAQGTMTKSLPFSGGTVASCWLRCYMIPAGVSQRIIGLCLSTSPNSGLFIGTSSSSNVQLAIHKYDGTTWTQLQAENAGTSSLTYNSLCKIDMQVIGPLSACTVNVYVSGNLVLTWSGNLTGAVSSFDSVYLNGSTAAWATEIIVANEDTRAFSGLVTMALTGAGTTDNWTGSTYSNINGVTISDASPMYTNSNAQDSQYNITDLPTGSFAIKAVKIAARAAKSSSPAVTQIQLGYNDGGSVAFGGSAVPVTTAYTTYEQLDQVDPNGGSAFAQSIMNALQLDVRSAT